MRVVILGAGALGASLALALAKAGAGVTLVERERPGSGTSSRGAGLVSEGMWHPTSLRLVSRSIELLDEMSREGESVGHPFRFHQTGSTTLVPPRLVPAAHAIARMQQREGVPVRVVQSGDVCGLPRHEGVHVDDVALALHYLRDGWALPRLYSEVCHAQAQMAGARVVRGEARVMREGERVAAWVGGERIDADAVVVAAGVWTRGILREAGLDAPLLAYRTQAMKLADPAAEPLPILHDVVQGMYLRPGIPQHLVAGDGTTTTPEDLLRWKPEADASFVEATVRRLRHRFPVLEGRVTESWAGVEAATPDRLLLAGPHPEDARVWLLAGGNGHGFMRAPAAAESVAATMLGKTPRVDIDAYAPARFPDLSAPFEIREGFSLEEPALK